LGGRSGEAGIAAEILLPRRSAVYRALQRAAIERRCVFLAGLPGVGKSLMLQQLALLADEAGRTVHLLQWDVARGAFETPAILARYPEVDSVTHAAIRKAVGIWAREAVGRWHRALREARHLLIGETPLVGNRLIELAQRQDDDVEPLLAGAATLFLIPAPSREVRRLIEAARVREMASPRHERELANAPPALVRAHWREIDELAGRFGLTRSQPAGYDPDVYVAVYRRLLRHRRTAALPITSALPVRASPYERAAPARDLLPTPDDVERFMARVEAYPPGRLEREVASWFAV
jgi:hypothetical protein